MEAATGFGVHRADRSQADCDTPIIFAETRQSKVHLSHCVGFDCISRGSGRLPLWIWRYIGGSRRGPLAEMAGYRAYSSKLSRYCICIYMSSECEYRFNGLEE